MIVVLNLLIDKSLDLAFFVIVYKLILYLLLVYCFNINCLAKSWFPKSIIGPYSL